MQIVTASGSVYDVEARPARNGKSVALWAAKAGREPQVVIAIYPDRLPAFEASVRWEIQQDGRIAGFNTAGVRTCLLHRLQVKPGMILVNPAGMRSTAIVKIA